MSNTMDVLKPPIIQIGTRRYRKNPIEHNGAEPTEQEEEVLYTEGGRSCMRDDEVCDAGLNLDQTETGQYRTTMDIPSAYFKFIIGKKGETKRRLETETRTQVRIPKQGVEGELVIVGEDRQGVISARTRIDVMVNSARQHQPFTHFLSLPITSANIKGKFQDFKSNVLLQCDGDRGLDDTIFQNPDKLHMTVGMLVLLNDSEIQAANGLLQECQHSLVDPILRGESLKADINGLEYMNDDPGAVDVLFAKLQFNDESDRLQILADRLVDKFVSSGMMQQEYDGVKLHITVINSLMRKDPSGALLPRGDSKKGPPRESFDASKILKKFKDYNFGKYHLRELHLSKRYSTDPTGYYSNDGVLKLP